MKNNFENLLIKHCSPTLAGLKVANLFFYNSSNYISVKSYVNEWNNNLNKHGVFIKIIKKFNCGEAYLIYVYRVKKLSQILNSKDVLNLLKTYGYEDTFTIDECIDLLSTRLSESPSFPHEIGVFLGYPLHDVVGFIENKGRNYCCVGCWKVYNNPQEAQRCFARYKKCTSVYLDLHRKGKSITQLTIAA